MLAPHLKPKSRAHATGPTGKVRVIGGSLRNSKLPVFASAGLRPTPDRVRETLFNWLSPAIDGARCLDLFAGSGVLGIEALSRGAAAIVLVEADALLAQNLHEQVARLQVADRAHIVGTTVEAYLREAPVRAFDIVFVDPPYQANAWRGVLDSLTAGAWLHAGTGLYLEWPHPARPELPQGLAWWRQSRAGAIGFGLAHAMP